MDDGGQFFAFDHKFPWMDDHTHIFLASVGLAQARPNTRNKAHTVNQYT